MPEPASEPAPEPTADSDSEPEPEPSPRPKRKVHAKKRGGSIVAKRVNGAKKSIVGRKASKARAAKGAEFLRQIHGVSPGKL